MTRVKTTILEQFGDERNRGNDELLCENGYKIDKKDEGNMRIRFQNITGFKGMITAAHEVFVAMEEKEMYILGISETNINWSNTRRLEANMAIKIQIGQGRMIASLSKTSKEGYLPKKWPLLQGVKKQEGY